MNLRKRRPSGVVSQGQPYFPGLRKRQVIVTTPEFLRFLRFIPPFPPCFKVLGFDFDFACGH